MSDVCLQNLDIDSVDLNADEWTSDINNVTGVLKMWLRELPEPLMTNTLQAGFVEAASTHNLLSISCLPHYLLSVAS